MLQAKVRRVRSHRSGDAHKFEVTRGENTRVYENPTVSSRVRMTAVLTKLVDLGRGLICLSSFDWSVVAIEGR